MSLVAHKVTSLFLFLLSYLMGILGSMRCSLVSRFMTRGVVTTHRSGLKLCAGRPGGLKIKLSSTLHSLALQLSGVQENSVLCEFSMQGQFLRAHI